MKNVEIPESLYDVFGQKQSVIELCAILLFTAIGTFLVFYTYTMPEVVLSDWRMILGFVLIADIFAGCLANFTHGTNGYYAVREKNRLMFILLHVHLLVIAWLLAGPLMPAVILWCYTLVAALLVNALKGHKLQLFFAANMLFWGMCLLILFQLPIWFLLTSLFFMIKVAFGFAVDHYPSACDK